MKCQKVYFPWIIIIGSSHDENSFGDADSYEYLFKHSDCPYCDETTGVLINTAFR